MVFARTGGCRGGLGSDDAVLVDCRYRGVVLSEKGEDEGRRTCGEVIYGAKCEGTEHGCDDWREEEGWWEDAG